MTWDYTLAAELAPFQRMSTKAFYLVLVSRVGCRYHCQKYIFSAITSCADISLTNTRNGLNLYDSTASLRESVCGNETVGCPAAGVTPASNLNDFVGMSLFNENRTLLLIPIRSFVPNICAQAIRPSGDDPLHCTQELAGCLSRRGVVTGKDDR